LLLAIPALKYWLVRATLTALVVLPVLSYGPVSANGRATLLISQEAGPYRIDVSMLPGKAVVGKNHLSILVRSLANDQVVTAATINVSAAGPEGATDLGPMPARNASSPQFFDLDLPFDAAGDWEVSIAVSSQLGEATIQVPLQVQQGDSTNWILIAAVGVAILAASIWTWDRITHRNSKSHPQ